MAGVSKYFKRKLDVWLKKKIVSGQPRTDNYEQKGEAKGNSTVNQGRHAASAMCEPCLR